MGGANVIVGLLIAWLAGGLGGYALAKLQGRPGEGFPIKLRHQSDVHRFTAGKLHTIDEPVELARNGVPVATGTFEGELLVVDVDEAAGMITLRARP